MSMRSTTPTKKHRSHQHPLLQVLVVFGHQKSQTYRVNDPPDAEQTKGEEVEGEPTPSSEVKVVKT